METQKFGDIDTIFKMSFSKPTDTGYWNAADIKFFNWIIIWKPLKNCKDDTV